MSRHRDQVAAALAAVTIRGPARYAWLGRGSRPLPASVGAHLDEAGRRGYLVACLREELYWSFYCRGAPVPARWGEPESVSADPWLVEAMSRANTGRGSWEPGWTVERLDGEEAVAASAQLRARIPLGDCRALADGIAPGAPVAVRLPKELPSLSPGFSTIVSDAPRGAEWQQSIVRVYWNVGPAGAPALVRALTSRLNRREVPFRLKVADHAFRLDRCDAAVLYLPAGDFAALRGTLRQLAATRSAQLRPEVPAFTLELAPGVGAAEDGGDGESFGVRRCALLADAIVRAHELGAAGPAALDVVATRFAEDGVQLDAPYLEPSLAGRHVL